MKTILHKFLFHKNHDTMADKNLQQYEMMVMIKPDLTQKATKEALQTVRDLIAEAGGKINHEDLWEKRDIAYSVKGYDQAYYAILYFFLNPANLAELKADLDLEQPLLRRMIIKFPTSLSMETYLEEAKKAAAQEEIFDAERAAKSAERAEKEAQRAARRKPEAKKEEPAPAA